MVDDDAVLIAHQRNVARRRRYPIELVEFLPGSKGYSFGSRQVIFQLTGGQNSGRISRCRIDSEIDCRSPPRRIYQTLVARAVAFNDGLNSVKMFVRAL